MPIGSCQICRKKIYIKPSHVRRGWGKYCSKKCQAESQRTGKVLPCGVCGKKVWRGLSEIKHSRSGKVFCSKSCSAVWRNKTVLAGEHHVNWKTGIYAYRNILGRTGQKTKCIICGLTDKRILIVHHKDKNRQNNKSENLCWLCWNCHYLVHHYPKEYSMEALV